MDYFAWYIEHCLMGQFGKLLVWVGLCVLLYLGIKDSIANAKIEAAALAEQEERKMKAKEVRNYVK